MFDSFFPPVENCIAATRLLLKTLKVNVTKRSFNAKLIEHPSYPSLLSVSDALQEWSLETLAVKFDKDRINELPTPFVAQIKDNFEDFLL